MDCSLRAFLLSKVWKLSVPLIATALVSACVLTPFQNEPKIVVGLGEEKVPPEEAEQINQIVAIHSEIQEQIDFNKSPVPRGQHPKQHGCIAARFIVEPDLPEIFKRGVFQKARSFEAIVRFSNGRRKDDRYPDAHGMAIKLLDVKGTMAETDTEGSTSQDFIMIDSPLFFVRNVDEYVPLMKDFRSIALGGFVKKSLVGLKFLFSPFRQYRLLRAVAKKQPDNPLAVQYWSTTPSRLGNLAIKFSARPSSTMTFETKTQQSNSKDKLRIAMSELLRQKPASFDFLVQRQTDPVLMPVEDPTVQWDESLSPFIKVATITLPMQTFESAEQMTVCENLSFSPWHSLEELRPLGGINRARKKVYEVLSLRRTRTNNSRGSDGSASQL